MALHAVTIICSMQRTGTDNKVLRCQFAFGLYSAYLHSYSLLDKLYQGRNQGLIIVLWNLFSQ